jgi:hypothetical protein
MKSTSWFVATAIAFTAIGGCHHEHHDRANPAVRPVVATVPVTTLPAGVLEGFGRAHPGAKIKRIEQATFPDGRVEYIFHYTHDGKKEHKATFNSSGQLVS